MRQRVEYAQCFEIDGATNARICT
eukprot:SAG31_NODE_32215_length_358_cov_1.189189_1_plen_23_part_01